MKFARHSPSRSAMTRPAPTGAVGRQDGFYYDVMRRRRRPRSGAQDPLDGGRGADVRGDRGWGEVVARSRNAARTWSPRARPAAWSGSRHRPEPGPRGLLLRSSTRRLTRGLERHARRAGVPVARTACARVARATWTTRAGSTGRAPSTRVDYEPGESHTGDVRRQLQLARTGLVPAQLPAHPGAAQITATTATTLHGRVPARLGATRHAARGGGRAEPAAGVAFLRRPARSPAGVRRRRDVPDRPALARPAACSTSTSTATPATASAPATRRDGPAPSPC